MEDVGEDGVDEHQGQAPVLADDYGESCLAEYLGIPQLAEAVVPVRDSQILRESDVADGLPLEFPDSQPREDEIPATSVDDSQLAKSPEDAQTSPPITPTELEMTPQPASVIEVVESPPMAAAAPVSREEMATMSVVAFPQQQQAPDTVVATDGSPTSKKYTQEELAALQEKINYLKQLLGVLYLPFSHAIPHGAQGLIFFR